MVSENDKVALAAELRRRLGPPPSPRESSPVSIVVVNRDGVKHLRTLLSGLIDRTDYGQLELIVVDNGSRDESLEFIRTVKAPFPIAVVANPDNESFSDACNQGAALASGALLLMLNNDIDPFEPDWLTELVACLRSHRADAVGATLVCPEAEQRASFRHGYGIAHRGLEFREEDDRLHPALRDWEANPLDDRLGEDCEPPAVAAACMLLDRDAFTEVGGFTSGFFYGCEDVDLCLKLRQSGRTLVCSGRSVAIHYPVSTRRTIAYEQAREIKRANLQLLWARWGPRLRGRPTEARYGEAH